MGKKKAEKSLREVMKEEIKIDEKEDDKSLDNTVKPLINKGDLFWIGAFIGAVIFGIFVVYLIFNNMAKVEYEGLTFVKERYGELIFYKYVYSFNHNGAILTYNFYVRNNPKENNISVQGGEITLPKGRIVYLTINETGLNECPMANLAVGALSGFITDNQFSLRVGVPDKEIAEQKDTHYITCQTNLLNPVIHISEGNQTMINVDGLCYDIKVANCEVLKAVEKFETQVIIDAKKRMN